MVPLNWQLETKHHSLSGHSYLNSICHETDTEMIYKMWNSANLQNIIEQKESLWNLNFKKMSGTLNA